MWFVCICVFMFTQKRAEVIAGCLLQLLSSSFIKLRAHWSAKLGSQRVDACCQLVGGCHAYPRVLRIQNPGPPFAWQALYLLNYLPKPSKHSKETLWRLISIFKLTGFRNTEKIHLWVCFEVLSRKVYLKKEDTPWMWVVSPPGLGSWTEC